MRASASITVLAFGLTTLLACGPTTPPPAAADTPRAQAPARFGLPFSSPLHNDDPRAGQIVLDGKEVRQESEWLDRAFGADVVYLGEKHDNADHHRLQAHVIAALVAQGARPAVVLEMVDADEQGTLDQLSTATRPDELRDALKWSERGWPAFEIYEPIFQQAITHRLRLVAGNAPKATVKRIAFAGHGGAPVEATLLTQLGLDVPLPEAAQSALVTELVEAHCGMLPASAAAPMALAQRARDFMLAKTALATEASARGPRSVVIAGAGHVRNDRGAPFVARRTQPGVRQFSMAFAEVSSSRGASAEPYDAVWYTPVANEDDHCKDFGAPPKKPSGT